MNMAFSNSSLMFLFLTTVSLTALVQCAIVRNSNTSNIQLDPEAKMNITQLITSKGYPFEQHYVRTHDGFILGLQRIPNGHRNRQKISYRDADRPVVLLQHGHFSLSSCWVENLVNESLGFLMADNGFDVWLANSRGNTYSRKHATLTPDDDKFWEWSWDEMAEYDIPATVDYILNATNKKYIYYVGHSQGTLIGFAGFSGAWNTNKIKMFFALAPIAYMGNMISPIRYLAPFTQPLEGFFDLFGHGEFLPQNEILRFLGQEFCPHPAIDLVCENLLFLIGGFDSKETNITRLPVYAAENPAGSSVQNLAHYCQSILHKDFKKYDYGSDAENLAHYNQTTPPQYHPSDMKTPVVLYTGSKDWLADPADVKILLPQLSNVVATKNIDGWQHLDFIWGMNAPQEVYDDVMSRIHAQAAIDMNSS